MTNSVAWYDVDSSELYSRCVKAGSFDGLAPFEYRALRNYQVYVRQYFEMSWLEKYSSDKSFQRLYDFAYMQLPGELRLVVSAEPSLS